MLKTLESIPLNRNSVSESFTVKGKGNLSIQSVVSNLVGTPTYTLEVSNDDDNFVEFDPLSTNVSFEDSIEIDSSVVPWIHMRARIDALSTDGGSVIFKINFNG
jgi:vacuolar-type H+-ATPase subunit D/Vma8